MSDESEELKELNIKKRKFRRNAALISFVLLIFMTIYYITIGLFVTTETAGNVSEFNSVSITLAGVFVSILLGHLGIDYFEKK